LRYKSSSVQLWEPEIRELNRLFGESTAATDIVQTEFAWTLCIWHLAPYEFVILWSLLCRTCDETPQIDMLSPDQLIIVLLNIVDCLQITATTNLTHSCCQCEYLRSYRASAIKLAHSACSGMILIEVREGRIFLLGLHSS